MTQPIFKNSFKSHKSIYEDYSILELIAEMDILGVNPKPLLEIAATDIWKRHGAEGLNYVKLMRDQVTEAQDMNGIFLWTELHKILSLPSSLPISAIN